MFYTTNLLNDASQPTTKIPTMQRKAIFNKPFAIFFKSLEIKAAWNFYPSSDDHNKLYVKKLKNPTE